MKWFLSFLAFAALIVPSHAYATAIGDSEFTKVVYLESAAESPTPKASNSGRDYGSALPLVTGNVYSIPKNVIVTNAFLIVDEAIAGPTAFSVGDDDLSTGFITSSAPQLELAILGLHYWDVAYKGAYLKDSTVVSNHVASRFYSATGKSIVLTVTGTASRGKARLFIKGYNVSAQ